MPGTKKAARGRLFHASKRIAYLEPEAALAAESAAEEAEAAAAEAEPAAAEAAPEEVSAAGAGAGAGAAAGAGAGAGAGSSFLPQAARAAAAISVARTSDFFISGFLLGMGDKFPESVPAAFVPLVTEWKKPECFPAQPTIIAVCRASLGAYPKERNSTGRAWSPGTPASPGAATR